MNISAETLIAYVDGELSESDRADLEAALAADETLRARVARERGLRQRLSAAFDPTLAEAVPPALVSAANAIAGANVVALQPRRRSWSYREWGAMAASLAGGLIIGLGVLKTQTPAIAPSASGLVARGALAQALETQIAADTDGAVRIGVSFRSREGAYCRTFAFVRDHVTGLACKRGAEWQLPVTAQISGAAGEVRTAASDIPAPILAAVDTLIDGDPLDARAETVARDRHWLAAP